ncbi:hypothetical protein [Actinomadura hibisca]|uniref:hypothetical protein n=1 Tax=Actinomadura hibisca TaxID=68565 RepID=UPI00082FC4D8|nr:hypothetical protein [Actinomadura hibisca]
MRTLEDRYRRLLRWYPAEHRRVHEDEMLGVLLATAEPGRSRPPFSEATDLICGGLWLRFRYTPERLRRAGWPDAAALTALLAPLLLLALTLRYALDAVLVARLAEQEVVLVEIVPGGLLTFDMFNAAPAWLAAGTAAVLALAGLRRTTAVVAVAAAVFQMVTQPWEGGTGFVTMTLRAVTPGLLLLMLAAAVLVSPGPRRAVRLLGGTGVGLAVVAACAAVLAGSRLLDLSTPLGNGPPLAATAVAGAAAGVMLLRSAGGRRAAVVLAVPLAAPLLMLGWRAALLLGAGGAG